MEDKFKNIKTYLDDVMSDKTNNTLGDWISDYGGVVNENYTITFGSHFALQKMLDRRDKEVIRIALSHAINSHDELVQMNQELLAALKQVVGDVRALADHSYGVHGLHQNGDLAPWNSLFSGGFFESWLLSVDDADAVIAKTEGGAA